MSTHDPPSEVMKEWFEGQIKEAQALFAKAKPIAMLNGKKIRIRSIEPVCPIDYEKRYIVYRVKEYDVLPDNHIEPMSDVNPHDYVFDPPLD